MKSLSLIHSFPVKMSGIHYGPQTAPCETCLNFRKIFRNSVLVIFSPMADALTGNLKTLVLRTAALDVRTNTSRDARRDETSVSKLVPNVTQGGVCLL